MPHQPLDYKASQPAHPNARIPLILGALVLLIYPFCLLANVMSLSAMDAPRTRITAPLHRRVMQAFLWGSNLYPLVYAIAAALSLFLSSNDRPTAARRVAWVPLIYLLGVLQCFVAWQLLGA